jgi:hypothetical protein
MIWYLSSILVPDLNFEILLCSCLLHVTIFIVGPFTDRHTFFTLPYEIFILSVLLSHLNGVLI